MGNKQTSYFVIKSAPDSMKTSQNLLSHYPYGHSPIPLIILEFKLMQFS